MDNEQLGYFIRDYIKNNLTISIDTHCEAYVGDGIKVTLELDGEEISSEWVLLEHWSDY